MGWRSPGAARLPCVVDTAGWFALPLRELSLCTVRHFGLTAAFLVGGLARRPGPPVEDEGRSAHRESRGGEDHDPADSSVRAA